jgi:hypothetical protein
MTRVRTAPVPAPLVLVARRIKLVKDKNHSDGEKSAQPFFRVLTSPFHSHASSLVLSSRPPPYTLSSLLHPSSSRSLVSASSLLFILRTARLSSALHGEVEAHALAATHMSIRRSQFFESLRAVADPLRVQFRVFFGHFRTSLLLSGFRRGFARETIRQLDFACDSKLHTNQRRKDESRAWSIRNQTRRRACAAWRPPHVRSGRRKPPSVSLQTFEVTSHLKSWARCAFIASSELR